MQGPIQPNPDADVPIEETQEYKDALKWLTETPEGQALREKSENDPHAIDDYMRWVSEGESHEQAMQGWTGTPRRIARDVQDIPGEFATVRRDPFGGFTEHYEQRLENAGVTSHAGAVGLVAFDIVWGTIAGTADAIYDISRGQFDLEQVAHAGSVLVPWARTMMARGLASQLAKKTVVGAGTTYYVPKEVWQGVVQELDPRDLHRLRKAGILDERLQVTETGMEVMSLTLEAEEWVHELVGAGVMRGFAETSASIFRTKQPGETPPELPPGRQALPAAPVPLPPGQPQLPGQPDTEPIELGGQGGVPTAPDVIEGGGETVSPEMVTLAKTIAALPELQGIEPDTDEATAALGDIISNFADEIYAMPESPGENNFDQELWNNFYEKFYNVIYAEMNALGIEAAPDVEPDTETTTQPEVDPDTEPEGEVEPDAEVTPVSTPSPEGTPPSGVTPTTSSSNNFDDIEFFEPSKVTPTAKFFNTAKESPNTYTPDKSQDSVAFDETTGRYVLADGVSRSLMPTQFSRGLVNKFLREPIQDWNTWVGSVGDRWQQWMVNFVQSGKAPYFIVNSLGNNEKAASTFVGLQFNSNNMWQAHIIGDSALFRIRNGQIESSYGARLAGSSTDALTSDSSIQQSSPEIVSGDVQSGDVFLLMSDALGDWLVEQEQAGKLGEALARLESIQNETDYQAFIDEVENDTDSPLQHDDQSFIWINGEEAVKAVTTTQAGVEPDAEVDPDGDPTGGVEPTSSPGPTTVSPTVPPEVELQPSGVEPTTPSPDSTTAPPETVAPTPDPGPLFGTPDRVVYSSNRSTSYRTKYGLMELDDLIPSHELDGNPNPRHKHPDVQPREERGGIPSLKLVDKYAREMITEFFLDPVATLIDGAPILSFKIPPHVLSGNGRVMALLKAFRDYPVQWQKYQEALAQALAQYGISPDQLTGMRKPVLVQLLQDDVNERDLAIDANKKPGLAHTSTETATYDARYLTDDVMVQWALSGESLDVALESDENTDFRAALLEAIPDEDHPEFLTSDLTKFSDDGVDRVRNMMMRYVFQGEYGALLSQTLIESKFDSIKNIQNMLDVAIPHLALVESYVRHGLRDPKLSISEDVARAVGVLRELAENNESVVNFVHQDMLFAPRTVLEALSETGLEILALMDEKQRAYQQLASVFMRYTQAVLDEGLPGESLVGPEFDLDTVAFFENEIREHFKNSPPTEIQKWRESEEKGDPDENRPPRTVPDFEFDERVTAYVDNYLERIRAQAVARAVVRPKPEFDPDATYGVPDGDIDPEPDSTPRPEGIERTGVTAPPLSPDQISPPELEPPDVELPTPEGTTPEGTQPDGVELTAPPEPRQPPPNLPKNPTVKLIDIVPKGESPSPLESVRTYTLEERPDVEIRVNAAEEGLYVSVMVPGFVGDPIFVERKGAVFNDGEAKRAVLEALDSEQFYSQNWQLNPTDPFLDQGIEAPSEAEQSRIDKMPHLRDTKKFKDSHTNSRRGIAFEMPGLDPGMRLKTIFDRGGRYTVYIESSDFSPELENYDLGDGSHILVPGRDGNPTTLTLRNIPGVDPVDALKRGLARVIPDRVWDNLNTTPEPNTPPDQQGGTPGIQPDPVPDDVQLLSAPAVDLIKGSYYIGDATGKRVNGYHITVDPDPLGLNDNVMEVTITFPKFDDLAPLVENVYATSMEEAALNAINMWRGFELGKGGIGTGTETQPEHTPIQAGESLLEDDLPPVIKSSERPFGKLVKDTKTMEFEGLAPSGVRQIYRFSAPHAPQVRVRKLGDTQNPEWHIELRHHRRNAAHFTSYKKTYRAAINEAIEAIEASDHEWKPLYKSGVFAEIDGIMNAVNRRQFATTPAIERRIRGLFTNLRRGVKVDLRGYKLTSLKELAIMGQVFRNPKFESSRIFYLNENHEIVGHDMVAFGIPASTGVVPHSRIHYMMQRLGAKYFVDMHNHPSGNTILSSADRAYMASHAQTFRELYLGSIVINTGEYTEVRNLEYQEKFSGQTKFKIQAHERRRLGSAELGWNTGDDPALTDEEVKAQSNVAAWSPAESIIRPNDPMYQYDIDTESGKMLSIARQIGEKRDLASKRSHDDQLTDIAKLGKYLQTEENWTTLFFTNYAHEILAVIEYKDLHLLDGNQLWNFINTEARKHGGVYVSAYVGEGDWYKTYDDVKASGWGEVLKYDSMARSLEHAWFAGLVTPDNRGVYESRDAKRMLMIHDDMAIVEEGDNFYKVIGMTAGIQESQMDSDFGVDTKLTEPNENRTTLIKELLHRIEKAKSIDIETLYTEAFGSLSDTLKSRLPILNSFVQMVTNSYLLNVAQEIPGYGPVDAVNMYKGMLGMHLQSGLDKTQQTANRGAAYATSRLAYITENDRVLTMGDVDGMLATFAKIHNPHKVMSTTTDGYTQKLFNEILPGVSEIHNIEDQNLAREWQGERPTVILLNATSNPATQIDEAMKVLAPNGRLVVVKQAFGPGAISARFWATLQLKYPIRDFSILETDDSGGWTDYIVIDKTRNTIGQKEVQNNVVPRKQGEVDLDRMFAEVESFRNERIPPTDTEPVPFEGVTPEEQTFFTPIDNPYRPERFRQETMPIREPEANMEFYDAAGDEPGVQTTASDDGTPVRGVSDPPGDTPPPDDTPTGVSNRVRSWVREKFTDTNQKWYPISFQTAKVTLEKLGATGLAVGESLKRIRNVGDRFTGRGTSTLDDIFPKAERWVKSFAEDRNLDLGLVIREFNQVLVRHHEGRSMTRVPKVMDEIVDRIKAWVTENIENPMLKINQDILRQGLLFEMPENLIEQKVLSNEYRKELEQDLPDFEKFMRTRKDRDEFGLVQGFVRHNETGKVYAIRVKGDVYVDPKMEAVRVNRSRVRYTLESPFKERIEGEQTMLYNAHDEYTLIASRNPVSRRWDGKRSEAKEAWDAEIENNPRPDVLFDYFSSNGITLPEGVRFAFKKVANLEEWSVRHEGQELYRIRRIVPVEISKRKGEFEEAHSAYNPFKSRLLVYDAQQVRPPVFIYRGVTAHKLWQPIPNYFPHVIDWRTMNPDPGMGRKYERFVKYVQEFAHANEMEFDTARAILTQYIADSKTRKYGHLEQDRMYKFPAYNRNYFQVWEQYMARAGHRMQTIREFGQQNDLLTARLNEFVSEDAMSETLSESEKAVLKLRMLAGYNDFTPPKTAHKHAFRNDDGSPSVIDPSEGDFVGLGPGDWATLVENGVLRALDDGTYMGTEAGTAMLENPAFLHGALMKGMRKLSVAADVVKNQLGWRQGDLFDEEMGDMIRGVQGWTGVLFLGRAWAANIAQSVNTAIVLDGQSLLKGFRAMISDDRNRKWAREVGAVAIDVMHDYGSGSALGTRVLRQQLGAVPRYQMGKSHLKSVLPTEEVIDDFGIKTHAWTPFYHIERMNRVGAALASRAYAVANIKDMINDPKGAKTARERLLSMPGAYELEGKLKKAMAISGLKVEDVERVSEMLPDEVRKDAPELWAVHDFLAEFAKETADWTQHRVEAMDRGRPWSRNPIFIMMQQLQSFNIAQTKFVKDQFKREWKIMHTFLNEKDLPTALQSKGASRALGSLWLIPRIFLWGGMFGIPTAILGKLIRFDAPDEDTINFATGLYKAGMFTQLGEYALQINRWNRGAEEIILGPTLGTVADVAGDVGQGRPLRTVSRLARPPLAGPSVKQIIEWTEPSSGKRRPSRRNRRGRRSGGTQRRRRQ